MVPVFAILMFMVFVTFSVWTVRRMRQYWRLEHIQDKSNKSLMGRSNVLAMNHSQATISVIKIANKELVQEPDGVTGL